MTYSLKIATWMGELSGSKRLALTGAVVGFCLCVVLVCFYFLSSSAPVEFRQPATNYIRVLKEEDQPGNIGNSGDGTHVWAMRENAGDIFFDRVFVEACQFLMDAPQLVSAGMTGAAPAPELAIAEKHELEGPRQLAPLLVQDGANAPRLLASVPYGHGDALDLHGRPVRWTMPENLLSGYSLFRPASLEPEAPPLENEKFLAEKLPVITPSGKASHYRELVESFARRYDLSVPLVMAIIHSESDFSPTLVSNKSAMGLMQLLPSTASDEVHRFLYGRRGQVSFEQLRVPEINIRYGTAYLHILFNRYFPDILNTDVRESCAIAAYNLGPNRFLRLYGATNGQAVEKINSMSAGEFYDDLPRRLPARETRFFVNKVRKMKEHYASVQ